ncbi:protein of unknown function (DUF3328) domain containing protein [Hyaloscypha variabilis]
MEKYQTLRQSTEDFSQDSSSEQDEPLMSSRDEFVYQIQRNRFRDKIHYAIPYSIIGLLSTLLILLPFWMKGKCVDPSIGLWTPVKDAVSYKTVKFDEYFENRSPYTPQTPTKELDEMWEDLYNFGTSGISADEASNLLESTVHLPHDDSTYVVSLGVFHQLHCVNHLRKALYPDEYPGLWQYNPDGTVKRDTIISLHWDHCIDILRQTLMCHADVTPMPYFYRARDDNVYSVLASTETCRDYDKIKSWALERQITHWRWNETFVQQN